MNEWLLTLGAALFVMSLFPGCASDAVSTKPGPLAPCANSPNCVSSADQRQKFTIAPLPYAGDWEAARQRLVEILNRVPRTQVTVKKERYIHAECRSRIFGFVDDLSFYFDPQEPVIQVRSAARSGYSDLGVNRKRVEEIRQMWMQQ